MSRKKTAMSQYYLFRFYDGNFMRQTDKAFGMAFYEDPEKIIWFAKSKSTVIRDFFGKGDHALAVHPWLAKKIIEYPEELIETLQKLGQLEISDLDLNEYKTVSKESGKIDGTVWSDPESL